MNDDYQEVKLARRGLRLVQDSGMSFSFLNVIVFIILIATIVAGVGSIFQ